MPTYRVIANFRYTQIVQSSYEIEAPDVEQAKALAEQILSSNEIETKALSWDNYYMWQDAHGNYEIFDAEIDDDDCPVEEGEFRNA